MQCNLEITAIAACRVGHQDSYPVTVNFDNNLFSEKKQIDKFSRPDCAKTYNIQVESR